MCWLLFDVRFTPVLPQWHLKASGHSVKNAGGRLHLNTHTPLIQRNRRGLTMPLSRVTRDLSGISRPQSSQFAEPLWTDPGLNSGISVRELISTLKKREREKKRRRKKADWEWMVSPKSSKARKKPSPPPPPYQGVQRRRPESPAVTVSWQAGKTQGTQTPPKENSQVTV